MVILRWYLILINIAAFVVMCVDKRRANRHRWRIPEYILFALALLGGSVGCVVGMCILRHKIRKRPFVIGFPVIMVIQIVGLLVLSSKLAA
jgi:uncharacterized membrane protein YsdA (DUF1294 family)